MDAYENRIAALETKIANFQASNNDKPYVFAAGSFDPYGVKVNGRSHNCWCKMEPNMNFRHNYGQREDGHYIIYFHTAMLNDNYSIMIQPHVTQFPKFVLSADIYEKDETMFKFRMSGTSNATYDSFSVTVVDYNTYAIS